MKVTNFITSLNGVITGQHNGPLDTDFYGTSYYGHEIMEIPENVTIGTYDKLEWYSKDWKREDDVDLIDEGKLPMPKNYVREGRKLRKMNHNELVISGQKQPDSGFKVEDGKIVQMSFKEKNDTGLLSDEDYKKIIAEENIAELNNKLSELLTPDILAQAEVDEEFAAERKTKLSALLAVKQQPNWPLEVEWPE